MFNVLLLSQLIHSNIVHKKSINFSHCSLGPLVCKVKEYQVEGIVDTLCSNMAADKEQLRDISSIGIFA